MEASSTSSHPLQPLSPLELHRRRTGLLPRRQSPPPFRAAVDPMTFLNSQPRHVVFPSPVINSLSQFRVCCNTSLEFIIFHVAGRITIVSRSLSPTSFSPIGPCHHVFPRFERLVWLGRKSQHPVLTALMRRHGHGIRGDCSLLSCRIISNGSSRGCGISFISINGAFFTARLALHACQPMVMTMQPTTNCHKLAGVIV